MVDESSATAADPPVAAPLPDGGTEFTYLRIVDPVTPDAYLKGVIRTRIVDGHPSSEVFTRSQGWKGTVMPVEHRLGLLENDLVEISPATAHDLIAQLRALWQGDAGPVER